MPTAAQLSLQNVTRRYDDHVVLDDVSFSVKPGERAGIVGDNGAGKSTLLRLIAGQDRPDNGELTVVAPGGSGYLAQSLALPPEATVQAAVDMALADLRELEARMHHAEAGLTGLAGAELTAALDAYAHMVAQYEARAGYEADARVDIALHGLGLPGLARDRTLGTLSGGERSRLALAATLASQPELLLLDEPTNDLDDQAVGWLEAHLRAQRGTVLVVTHDRVFLERVTTTILEVGEGKVTRHGDGYDGYLAAKAAERRRLLREYADWSAELARNQKLAATNVVRLEAIPRKLPFAVFGHGGFRARGRGHGAMVRIRNAKERVERLTDNAVAPPPEPLVFAVRMTTAADGQMSQAAAELTGIRVEDRLHVPSLRIGGEERLLVTGPNGAGKTTLMRVLAGELRPDEGTVRTRGRVGHLRQEGTPWPPGLTVPQAFAHGRGGSLDERIDQLLSLGLFSPADLRLKVGELSYGQRRRIELARLVSEPVDLLLLDEPTNHLSPVLVEELEGALARYRGAVVVVTHDRRMRTRFTGRHVELNAGHVAQFQETAAG
ncbi:MULTISPECIES: TlrC/CarA/OleB/SrmB family ABC-F type ribosomal protection protein [unclassified Streptomyces]|uniref:TlrC/CarA/OleB/SrmB family ABC-F type ribosomal protection protein n=1 Tax=unclassified Streptomyces TaxID=2593676 RepID=UPI00048FC554|nr:MULTISPECIES: TlrC/CarA/OleB/SrmB family ABC-F type ribosomal protection protein [unclassified Streptomyces]MYR75350.1 TlrC/CarA/OleB/SrmB family ABC-F type ribosomal protection protein [Streptomyces sp. SID4925]MYY18057.1 TlrC/CarA/OleB/SrmB family ABC-F type ribosomal protection protein [Streptomyces sp. SID4912]SBU88072.1 macrolide transport system ATP-binding/permease protein [Streptomyces sp. OspMP-M45]SCD39956.1 macrolide transport system ATP-binding/permease protein [Streptomyces sp. 